MSLSIERKVGPLKIDEDRPGLSEAIASIPVDCLGSSEESGMFTLHLMEYLDSIRTRLKAGEGIPQNLFIQMGFSEKSAQEFLESPNISVADFANLPTVSAMLSSKDHYEVAMNYEALIRQFIAEWKEETGEEFLSILVFAEETREPRQDVFGLPLGTVAIIRLRS